MQYKPESNLTFWFDEITPKQWWSKSSEFDLAITSRFGAVHAAAARCELFTWRETPEGRLAEIIVLDQFSRNIYRDQAQAFDSDSLALALAQQAIAVKADQALTPTCRAFLYMPFMHSESPLIHQEAMTLFGSPGLEESLKSELKHKVIIDRFGRYPHRNVLIGRLSTEEELAFLQTPGSSF